MTNAIKNDSPNKNINKYSKTDSKKLSMIFSPKKDDASEQISIDHPKDNINYVKNENKINSKKLSMISSPKKNILSESKNCRSKSVYSDINQKELVNFRKTNISDEINLYKEFGLEE